MHLCIYVYSLHAYIMKENGKAAIQRQLARLEEWATRSLVKFSEDKRKVLDVGRKELWQEYKQGCLKGMNFSRSSVAQQDQGQGAGAEGGSALAVPSPVRNSVWSW